MIPEGEQLARVKYVGEKTLFLHFSTLGNNNRDLGTIVRSRGNIFNLLEHQHTVDDLTEYNVLSVQKVTRSTGDEKLTAVSVFPTIRHRKHPRRRVLHYEIFVGELGATVNTARTGPISVNEISTLDHEILNDSMEGAALVARGYAILAILACAELAEIFRSFRRHIGEELELNTANILASNRDVEKDDWILWIIHPFGYHRSWHCHSLDKRVFSEIRWGKRRKDSSHPVGKWLGRWYLQALKRTADTGTLQRWQD